MNKDKANNESEDSDVMEGEVIESEEIVEDAVNPDNEAKVSEDEALPEDVDPVQQEIESLKGAKVDAACVFSQPLSPCGSY